MFNDASSFNQTSQLLGRLVREQHGLHVQQRRPPSTSPSTPGMSPLSTNMARHVQQRRLLQPDPQLLGRLVRDQTCSNMFNGTLDSFNQPLNSWNVSSVITFMFQHVQQTPTSFNQPLNSWDVSSVDNMAGMFNFATAFSQNLGEWYVTLASATLDSKALDIPGVVGRLYRHRTNTLKNHSPTYGNCRRLGQRLCLL